MRTLLFLLIILTSNVCYGQLPIKDTIVVLITDARTGSWTQNGKQYTDGVSRWAEKYYAQSQIQQQYRSNNIQFVKYCGQDISKAFLIKWKVEKYPSLVTLKKVGNGYYLESTEVVQRKAQTYREPTPQRSPPQQYSQSQPPCPPGGS